MDIAALLTFTGGTTETDGVVFPFDVTGTVWSDSYRVHTFAFAPGVELPSLSVFLDDLPADWTHFTVPLPGELIVEIDGTPVWSLDVVTVWRDTAASRPPSGQWDDESILNPGDWPEGWVVTPDGETAKLTTVRFALDGAIGWAETLVPDESTVRVRWVPAAGVGRPIWNVFAFTDYVQIRPDAEGTMFTDSDPDGTPFTVGRFHQIDTLIPGPVAVIHSAFAFGDPVGTTEDGWHVPTVVNISGMIPTAYVPTDPSVALYLWTYVWSEGNPPGYPEWGVDAPVFLGPDIAGMAAQYVENSGFDSIEWSATPDEAGIVTTFSFRVTLDAQGFGPVEDYLPASWSGVEAYVDQSTPPPWEGPSTFQSLTYQWSDPAPAWGAPERLWWAFRTADLTGPSGADPAPLPDPRTVWPTLYGGMSAAVRRRRRALALRRGR